MTVPVFCRPVSALRPLWPDRSAQSARPDDAALDYLYYALAAEESPGPSDERLEADGEQVERWRAASAGLIADLQRIDRRSRRWPGRNPRNAARWRACRAFAAAAADLTERLHEYRRAAWAAAEQARAEARRAAVAATEQGAPIWRYHRHFCQNPTLGRNASIIDLAIDELDPCPDDTVDGEAGLTAEQLNAAVTRLRAEDPYVAFSWSTQTSQALRDWAGTASVTAAWQRMTGVEITDPPPRPRPPQPPRHTHFGTSGSDYGGFSF